MQLRHRARQILCPREVRIEQIVGFALLIVGLLSFWRPSLTSITAINQAFGIALPLHLFSTLFLIGGWLLAWQRSASMTLFSLLSLPYLAYGALVLAYDWIHPEASIMAAAISITTYFVAQMLFAKEQVTRQTAAYYHQMHARSQDIPAQ